MDSCHALIRVRVPDRPGALGLVASRIGALKSDIIGISVLDRADGSALDELAVIIPDTDLIPALAREIEEVDGTIVESIEIVDGVPEPRLEVLERAITLSRARSHTELATTLTGLLHDALRPEWTITTGPEIHVELGPVGEAGDVSFQLSTLGWAVGMGRVRSLTATELRLATGYCELADELGPRLAGLVATD